MNHTAERFVLTSTRGTHPPGGPIRSAFVMNIRKAIGDLDDPRTPIGIKPALQRLLLECDHYLIYGNEVVLTKLCLDAMDVCRQGWSYLSCWICSAQNICYSIYWALKAALEEHQRN